MAVLTIRAANQLATAAVALLLFFSGCHAARQLKQGHSVQTPWGYIKSTRGLEVLATLIEAANLTEALDQQNIAYTLFLPSNASFAALESDQGITVADLFNSSALQDVLLYHVHTGAALNETNLQKLRGHDLLMANNDTLRIADDSEIGLPLAFRDNLGRVAWPSAETVTIGHTVIYTISRVMLPIRATTLAEGLSYHSTMSTIHELMQYLASEEAALPEDERIISELLNSNATNVTFLVPTNDAFTSLCTNASQLMNNSAYLRKAVLSHFLPVALDFDTLVELNGTTIPTLNPDANVTVGILYGTIILYGGGIPSTLIINSDLIAGRSIMHTINTVLFPETSDKPTFTCPPPSVGNGDYDNSNAQYDYPYLDQSPAPSPAGVEGDQR